MIYQSYYYIAFLSTTYKNLSNLIYRKIYHIISTINIIENLSIYNQYNNIFINIVMQKPTRIFYIDAAKRRPMKINMKARIQTTESRFNNNIVDLI